MIKMKTLRENLQRAILETITFDTFGDLTNKQKNQRQWHTPLREHPQFETLTFETFNQSDKETWPDQPKDKGYDTAWPLWKLPQKATIEMGDHGEHVDISENWETYNMTIILTWQDRVTLDIIAISFKQFLQCLYLLRFLKVVLILFNI